MSALAKRQACRSLAGIVIVGLAAVAFAQSASAGDGDFFSSIFGGAPAQPAAIPQASDPFDGGSYQPPVVRRRPLTVKLHRPKMAHVAKPDGKPVNVSIFEDKTLRRGDAVMTAKGIRIFAGSSSWPYRQSDFVAIADAGRMNGSYQKALLVLDRPSSR